MPLERRAFLRTLSAAAAGSLVAARGREAFGADPVPLSAGPLILSSNENPLGPGEKTLAAVRASLSARAPGRYPREGLDELYAAIAASNGVKPENVLLGCGSTQTLNTITQLRTSRERPLAAGQVTYEAPGRYAELIGSPVRAVPLDRQLRLDLDGLLDAGRGAGLVFLCNPNNPTATLHGVSAVDDFVERLQRASPETTVLVDEAYHDYVTDPAYRTQVPRAIVDPRVIVSRTFSKAHGLAGLRLGYAIGHAKTIASLSAWDGPDALNALAIAAGIASLADPARIRAESARNAEARAFTVAFFEKLGFKATPSQANFIFVEIARSAREFREACRGQGVLVGRDFPPYEKTWARISIGTLEEMRRATQVFGKILAEPAAAAAA